METAGQRLKRVRERLGLRYREVEEASQRIAHKRENPEYAIALSRLSDIENKGTVPSIFRLYSLCSIYRLDVRETMRWYGVEVDDIPLESAGLPLPATHLAGFADILPAPSHPDEDAARHTCFLKRLHDWGSLSSGRLSGFDSRHYRYGYIGLEDWSMHPVLEPGCLVLIDIRRRRIACDGWSSEQDRPVYFLEHRDGYWCGWCSLVKDTIVTHPHPSSRVHPVSYRYPEQIEVVGEVVGIAMLVESRRCRGPRGSSTPAGFPSR
jgi:transcriptional regulator with XRE-family HTH domain